MFRFKDYFKDKSTLFIAEFANAFEGDASRAWTMIDKAVESDVDALKFQIFFTDELMVPEHPKYQTFKRLETSKKRWEEILKHAKESNKLLFIDVFGEESFEFSRNFEVDAYKIPPSDMTNKRLIERVAESGISTILSGGASTIEDIEVAVDICKKNSLDDFAIMHGFQNYPTKLKDTNLNMIPILSESFECPIGYADHIDGSDEMAVIIPLLAVAKGATLIEKHFTLNRELRGTDYQSSVNPDVLKKIVRYVNDLDLVLGDGNKKFSENEKIYREDVKKRIVAKRNLRSGEMIDEGDITFKRAPSGIFSDEASDIIGKTLVKSLKKNQVISWDNLDP